MTGDTLRILLLEDSPADAELNVMALRSAGLEFVSERVETRGSFVGALATFRPDVILSDYSLPGFDGRAAVQLAREQAPRVPTIIVTGSINEETAVECIKAGAADYVLKSGLGRLAPALRSVLEKKMLTENGERFVALAQSAPLAIVTADGNGKVLSWNAAAVTVFGYTEAEMVGHSVADLQPERYRDAHRRGGLPSRWSRNGGVQEDALQLAGLRKDGSEFPAEVILSRSGSSFGAIILDATERRRAEAALRRSEAEYRGVFENAVYGMYRSDREGRFQSVNAAMVNMLGYSSDDELLGLDPARDLYATPDDAKRALDNYGAERDVAEVELRWKHRDGHLILVVVSGRMIRELDGSLSGFQMIALDVTQRRSVENQLRQAQKMELVGEFTASIAHEFNNVLSIILSNSQVAVDGELLSDGLAQNLEEINEAGLRGARMIKQLVGFSRHSELKLKAVDLRAAVTDITSIMRKLVPESIETIMVAGGPVGTVRADRSALEQVLLNLATNARDAMPGGGVLRVSVGDVSVDTARCAETGVEPGDYVCVSVSDTGTGMSEEVRARLFEPFFTTKPRGAGTGLGMAMVQGLLQQQGCRARVSSEVGRGTTFDLYFPVVDSESGRAPAETLAVPLALVGGTETILLVEDEVALRRVGRQVLTRYGYEVLVAGNGEEALRIVAAHPSRIDLVVSDAVMPIMGGVELLRTLRGLSDPPRFLLVSGYRKTEALEFVGSDLGPVRFLSKPWTIESVLTGVRAALDGDGSATSQSAESVATVGDTEAVE